MKESPVWRSLFRQPYPTTSRTRALAVMNNVFLHLHPVRVKRHAVRYTYTFCLGGISFFLFLALTVTGLYLMFFYVPSISRPTRTSRPSRRRSPSARWCATCTDGPRTSWCSPSSCT